MWIEPTAFHPRHGKYHRGSVAGRTGPAGDPVPYKPGLIHEFIMDDSLGGGRSSANGAIGRLDAGLCKRLTCDWLFEPSQSDDFQPINSINISETKALRRLRLRERVVGKRARPRAEAFLRCAKSLVLSGPPNREQADRALGFTLELVAERNPYTIRDGGELPVRLTYKQRPLPGALVVAINRLNPSEKQQARTDADGRVRLRLRHRGMWLIKAVHMIPSTDANADWLSFWASLKFDLGDTLAAGNQVPAGNQLKDH